MSQLIMLGTGNAMCTRCYNTCFYLRTPSGGLMMDAGGGNGIFRQLFKARIAFEEVHNIFVTHCHPDHLLGVVWMIRKISPMMNHGRYQGTLTIYCHDEVAHALRTIGALLLPAKIWSAVDQTILFREVTDGEQVTIDDITLTCFDTGAVKRSERYARDCDWLLHEAFCLERDAAQFRPHEKHHSTALEAGQLAHDLGVKHLVLYHTEDTHLTTRRPSYTAEAATRYDGPIHVPDDIETIDLTK